VPPNRLILNNKATHLIAFSNLLRGLGHTPRMGHAAAQLNPGGSASRPSNRDEPCTGKRTPAIKR
jgi:hypothetical protein